MVPNWGQDAVRRPIKDGLHVTSLHILLIFVVVDIKYFHCSSSL